MSRISMTKLAYVHGLPCNTQSHYWNPIHDWYPVSQLSERTAARVRHPSSGSGVLLLEVIKRNYVDREIRNPTLEIFEVHTLLLVELQALIAPVEF